MRRLFLMCGWLATAGMIAISMRINFLFGASLGQTADKTLVFGCVSLVADAWKGLAPLFILALLRERRMASTAAASIVWLACFLFAISSALGIAIQDRMTVTGGREVLQTSYENVRKELDRQEVKRRKLSAHRSVGEIEADIAALLARPVTTGHRLRGTVGSISSQCTKVDARTTETCAEAAALRPELAAAIEAARLDVEIAALKQRAEQLRERGGTLSTDPQAELISRLTVGRVAPKDIGFGLVMLLAAVIELVSAFGPVVLTAYAEVSRKRNDADVIVPTVVAAGRGLSRQATMYRDENELVIEYMAERIAPAGESNAIAGDEIFADYVSWCARKKCAALARRDFLDEFDRQRRSHELEGKIRKFGNRYFGIQLSTLMLIR